MSETRKLAAIWCPTSLATVGSPAPTNGHACNGFPPEPHVPLFLKGLYP
jgi:hypothetical protein